MVALASRLDPFDGPPTDQLACEHDQRHVRVAEDLGAEGAADVRADAPDLVLRDAGHERGQQQPLDVRRLAGHPDRVLVGARVVPADVAPDLHRVGDQPLVDDPLADRDLGIGEGGVGARLVAHVPLEHDVVGRVLVELRRAGLGRLLGIDHRRQRLPVDLDQLQRVDRLGRRLGHDGGHALAGPLDVVRRKGPRGVDVVGDPAGAAGRPGHGQRVVRDVRADDDRDDTGRRLGRGDVDRTDVRVGVGTAEDGHVDHPRQLDVVEVAALAR